MDGAWRQKFSLGSCSTANLPIAEGSKSVPGILKLKFIQLDDLKTGNRGGTIISAAPHQPILGPF
jgi:hypothetical protein